MRENKIKQEDLEETVGFEPVLKGTYNWTLSEIRKLELVMNKKLI